MKKLMGLLAVGADPRSPGDGVGRRRGRVKAVQECFGTTYGQPKDAAWESGHATKPALGAKLTAIAHGCVDAA